MALTNRQRRRMHAAFEKFAGNHNHNYSKPQLDNAFDAFETERDTRDTALKAAVNTATTGRNWTVARYKNLYKAYMDVMSKDGW